MAPPKSALKPTTQNHKVTKPASKTKPKITNHSFSKASTRYLSPEDGKEFPPYIKTQEDLKPGCFPTPEPSITPEDFRAISQKSTYDQEAWNNLFSKQIDFENHVQISHDMYKVRVECAEVEINNLRFQNERLESKTTTLMKECKEANAKTGELHRDNNRLGESVKFYGRANDMLAQRLAEQKKKSARLVQDNRDLQAQVSKLSAGIERIESICGDLL